MQVKKDPSAPLSALLVKPFGSMAVPRAKKDEIKTAQNPSPREP
jgi:hypothetical protein